MGKVGKPQKQPGYQRVAQQRQLWDKVKQKHLTYPWFVQELEKREKNYQEYLQVNEPWKQKFNHVWSDKDKKNTYVTRTHEEILYWRLIFVGNGIQEIDDYRDVIQVPSWSLESCIVLQDIMCERKKKMIYEIYKQEKEKEKMNTQDKEKGKTQKVKFSSNLIFIT